MTQSVSVRLDKGVVEALKQEARRQSHQQEKDIGWSSLLNLAACKLLAERGIKHFANAIAS